MSWHLVAALPLAVGLACSSAAVGANFSVEKSEGGAIVKVDGELFTEYLVRSGAKPILWPVIGPTGKAMTRGYPMRPGPAKTERHDHPHQRSLWFSHGDVNGVDFWSELEGHGNIVHRRFLKLEGGPAAVIVSQNDWMLPDGKKVCEDQRLLKFGANQDQRWIDFDIVLKATAGKVTLGDTKEGTFGVRVAGTMDVDASPGGKIVNSRGQTDKEAWGQRAEWVDYHGPVEGEVLGIAIGDHPSSFRHPTYWHVRTYGLFTANPFGLHDFQDSADVDGSHSIESGESLQLRYRVLLHQGDEKQGRVAEAFEQYVGVKKERK